MWHEGVGACAFHIIAEAVQWQDQFYARTWRLTVLGEFSEPSRLSLRHHRSEGPVVPATVNMSLRTGEEGENSTRGRQIESCHE